MPRKSKDGCRVCQWSDTQVVDSRPDKNDRVWRRRECLKCGHRFTTHEVRADALNEVRKQLILAELELEDLKKSIRTIYKSCKLGEFNDDT